MHGDYDLTRGYFSCFSRERHPAEQIKNIIDSMYSGKNHEFHALALLGTVYDIRTQLFFNVVGLLEMQPVTGTMSSSLLEVWPFTIPTASSKSEDVR